MAWASIEMYRSGDELERRKIAEAILVAFIISTPLILAVGVLQFYLLPELNSPRGRGPLGVNGLTC